MRFWLAVSGEENNIGVVYGLTRAVLVLSIVSLLDPTRVVASEMPPAFLIGEVVRVEGRVFKPDGGKGEIAIRKNEVVAQKDTISTGAKSSFVVLLANGAEMEVCESTRIQFTRSVIKLFEGLIVIKASAESAPVDLSIATEMGRTDFSGSAFELSVRRSAESLGDTQIVRVKGGHALFVPFYVVNGKRPKNVAIEAGEELQVEADLTDGKVSGFRRCEKIQKAAKKN